MTDKNDLAVEAMLPLVNVSDQERISTICHMLKVSLLHALAIEDEDAQDAFNERMQEFIDEFTAEWAELE